MIQNRTDYAKSLGYTGTKKVLVQDGRVTSHRNLDWPTFCSKLRKK